MSEAEKANRKGETIEGCQISLHISFDMMIIFWVSFFFAYIV